MIVAQLPGLPELIVIALIAIILIGVILVPVALLGTGLYVLGRSASDDTNSSESSGSWDLSDR